MPSRDGARCAPTSHFYTGSLGIGLLAVLLTSQPVWAGDDIFGTDSPLTNFVDFIVGPFAYMVVIVALVVSVGILALGGEFNGFARRLPIIVVAGGIVILADTVLGNLFGGSRAFTLPPIAMAHHSQTAIVTQDPTIGIEQPTSDSGAN